MPKILTAPAMARCIGCDSCMLACARMVYNSFSPHKSAIQIRSRGGVMGRMAANICTACAEPVPCVEACPVRVIGWDEEETKPVVCIFCGQCARFCPHDCLALEEVG